MSTADDFSDLSTGSRYGRATPMAMRRAMPPVPDEPDQVDRGQLRGNRSDLVGGAPGGGIGLVGADAPRRRPPRSSRVDGDDPGEDRIDDHRCSRR